MPIYEYACHACRKRVSIFWPTIARAEQETPRCPRCGGERLTRLVSRVAFLRSEEERLESLADPANWSDFDENDPKSMAKFMRKMGSALDEDLGDEFDEMVDRLEAGEFPDEEEGGEDATWDED